MLIGDIYNTNCFADNTIWCTFASKSKPNSVNTIVNYDWEDKYKERKLKHQSYPICLAAFLVFDEDFILT